MERAHALGIISITSMLGIANTLGSPYIAKKSTKQIYANILRMATLRSQLESLLNKYFKVKRGISTCVLDPTERQIFTDELEELVQQNSHPFVPPAPDAHYVIDKVGYVAAMLKFQQAAAARSQFIVDDEIWEIEYCYANPLEDNRWDVRITLINDYRIRKTLNVAQFVQWLKQATEVLANFPSGEA